MSRSVNVKMYCNVCEFEPFVDFSNQTVICGANRRLFVARASRLSSVANGSSDKRKLQ